MARRGMGRPERVLPVVEMRRTDGSLGRSARARLAREKRAEQERLGVKVEAKPRVWSKQSTSQAKLSEREKLRLKEARRSARLASTNAVVDDTRLAFQHLGLDGPLRSQLTAIGIEKPTAIQVGGDTTEMVWTAHTNTFSERLWPFPRSAKGPTY